MPQAIPDREPPVKHFVSPILLISAVVFPACSNESTMPSETESFAPAVAATGSTLQFRQISTSNYPGTGGHTCAVTTDDLAYCWGSNLWGELGNDAQSTDSCGNPCETRPVAVKGGLHFKHVSAGGRFTCGVTTDNHAYCWGRNVEGQLGNGSTSLSRVPVPVSGGRLFRQIRAGEGAHTCAITPTNVAYCWGANNEGQLGDGTRTERHTPVKVLGGISWLQLGVGYFHTCGVSTSAKAYCWGRNSDGQVGDGTIALRLRPAAVLGGLAFEQIDTGFDHSCAVSTVGRAYCWGRNASGQLGNGTRYEYHKPKLVSGDNRYDHVFAGFAHSCGMTRLGRGLCWGANGAGQLGNGKTSTHLIPTRISGDLVLTMIIATYGNSCAVTTDRKAYCWGDNAYGQIGDGTSNNSPTVPTLVLSPS